MVNVVLSVAPQLYALGDLFQLASGRLEGAQQIDAHLISVSTFVVELPPGFHDGAFVSTTSLSL